MEQVHENNKKVITLNGIQITEDELKEKERDPSIRLIKEGDNSYRTLVRMVE